MQSLPPPSLYHVDNNTHDRLLRNSNGWHLQHRQPDNWLVRLLIFIIFLLTEILYTRLLDPEDGDVDPGIVQSRQVIIFMPLIAPDLLVELSCVQRLSWS